MPSPPQIVVFGDHNGDDKIMLNRTFDWLKEHRPDDWSVDSVKRLRVGEDLDHYDMSTRPEKGDAMDHITGDTRLVVALHVCGLTDHEAPQQATGDHAQFTDYCYDRTNSDLYRKCMELGVPLVAWGEQPLGLRKPENVINDGSSGPMGIYYERPGNKTVVTTMTDIPDSKTPAERLSS